MIIDNTQLLKNIFDVSFYIKNAIFRKNLEIFGFSQNVACTESGGGLRKSQFLTKKVNYTEGGLRPPCQKFDL